MIRKVNLSYRLFKFSVRTDFSKLISFSKIWLALTVHIVYIQ